MIQAFFISSSEELSEVRSLISIISNSSNIAVLPLSVKFATKPFSSIHVPLRNLSVSESSPDGISVTVRKDFLVSELSALLSASDTELFCTFESGLSVLVVLPDWHEVNNKDVIIAVVIAAVKNGFLFIYIPF